MQRPVERRSGASKAGRKCGFASVFGDDGRGVGLFKAGCGSAHARGGSITDKVELEFVDGLTRCFAGLDDPRVIGRCPHQLLDIVAIAILAVLCGAEDWQKVELSARCGGTG